MLSNHACLVQSNQQQQAAKDRFQMEKEAADQSSLRQRSEPDMPITNTTTQETKSTETIVIQRMEGETDEEYIKRINNKVNK